MDLLVELLSLALLLLLLAAVEVGFRAGRRDRGSDEPKSAAQVGAIQGAMLGLLGLLLGFSFAAAGSRFLERQDLIVAEANAIGTAFLRADLLQEPQRSELREALREYTHYRVDASRNLGAGLAAAAQAEVERQHARIWAAAIEGVRRSPDTMLGVLPPVNEVIDLHSTRLGAARKHLPLPVTALLIACSMLAMAVMGFGSGIGGRRRLALTVPLSILIAAALWITIDLDHPRRGLLRLNDVPLRELRFDPPR